jgi:putative polyketide hydroxylase
MTTSEPDVPVLVVGGGPGGLMTSLLLARYGVGSIVVERRSKPSILPRALGINARSMEIFRSLGLDGEIRAISIDARGLPYIVDMATLKGPVLETIPSPDGGDPEAAESPTPERLAFCAQNNLELLLIEKLRSSGLGEVSAGTELLHFEQDDSGVEVVLREATRGRERRVRASYLVGADGAGSSVRDALGIEMRGHGHISHELNVLFDADLRRSLGDTHSILYQVRHPDLGTPCLFRPIDGRLRWTLITGWFEDPSPARCAELVRRCAEDAALDVEVLAVGEWEQATLLADRFSQGRVFLVGDAAHRVTPRGAFGMNTAIQSAHNLAWKLAAVVRGWAVERLLDSYETERRPWTSSTVEMSHRLSTQHRRAAGRTLGHILGTAYETGALVPDGTPAPAQEDPVAEYLPSARPGRRAPHRWIMHEGRRISILDLFDGRFVVLSPSYAWRKAALEVGHGPLGVPLNAHAIADDGWQELYELGNHGAVLVRPDGHVGWRTRDAASVNSGPMLESVLASILDRSHPALQAAPGLIAGPA